MKIARTIVGSCLALSLTIPFTASASAASQSEHANAPHVSPVANPLESKLSQTADQNVKAAGGDAGLNVKGDGGWINWAFRGWFDRDNQHIEFHRP